MTMSTYLIDKIRRHGQATDRLILEIKNESGEFHDMPITSAIAFDAADFIWATLVSMGIEQAQESRYIRNHVAEAIIRALEDNQFPIPERLEQD